MNFLPLSIVSFVLSVIVVAIGFLLIIGADNIISVRNFINNNIINLRIFGMILLFLLFVLNLVSAILHGISIRKGESKEKKTHTIYIVFHVIFIISNLVSFITIASPKLLNQLSKNIHINL
jgi:hypothetical protein